MIILYGFYIDSHEMYKYNSKYKYVQNNDNLYIGIELVIKDNLILELPNISEYYEEIKKHINNEYDNDILLNRINCYILL